MLISFINSIHHSIHPPFEELQLPTDPWATLGWLENAAFLLNGVTFTLHFVRQLIRSLVYLPRFPDSPSSIGATTIV